MLTALIADDEPLARAHLRRMLEMQQVGDRGGGKRHAKPCSWRKTCARRAVSGHSDAGADRNAGRKRPAVSGQRAPADFRHGLLRTRRGRL